MLLRRYDREAKANKRLSMDKEELEWRLSQDVSGVAELLNRSISHSPTSSAASTPEPTRRAGRKSPLPSSGGRKSPPQQSPHSPRGAGGGGAGGEFYDIRRTTNNASGRRKVKSGDFDRPMFSPRHSSADLYLNQTSSSLSNSMFAGDSNDSTHQQRTASSSTSSAPAAAPADDSLMSTSTHSEPSRGSMMFHSPGGGGGHLRSNLRRSGTYELLAEEFESADDENGAVTNADATATATTATSQNLKQTDV